VGSFNVVVPGEVDRMGFSHKVFQREGRVLDGFIAIVAALGVDGVQCEMEFGTIFKGLEKFKDKLVCFDDDWVTVHLLLLLLGQPIE